MVEFLVIYGVIAVLAFWPMSIYFLTKPAVALAHAILWPWALVVYIFVWFLLPAPFAVLKALWAPVRKMHGFINRVEAARPNTVFECYEGRKE